MPPDELRRWLRKVPFSPFRIHVLEAISYEVRHPEQVILKLASLDFYSLASVPLDLVAMRGEVTIALRHITRLEELPPSAPSGNGQAG